MKKVYMIWWHRYVEEIDRNAATLKDILETTQKTLQHLEKLAKLETKGMIKVKDLGTLNPVFIQILDKSVEPEVAMNPIVDVEVRK